MAFQVLHIWCDYILIILHFDTSHSLIIISSIYLLILRDKHENEYENSDTLVIQSKDTGLLDGRITDW